MVAIAKKVCGCIRVETIFDIECFLRLFSGLRG